MTGIVFSGSAEIRSQKYFINTICHNRTLGLPKEVENWTLTTSREKLVKIGAKVLRHGHRLSDALGAAGDQVDATGQSLLRGIHPVCPAS